MKLYTQMMQQATGKASRYSTSSADPLVASSLSGTNPTPSTGIKSSPGMNPGGKKSTQRMSQMLKNKLMMTNLLAFNMFNRGAALEEAEEEEQAGPLQSSTLELTPYMPGDGGYGYSQPDAQQQIMAESLRAKYGTEADPSMNPSWKSQGQQGSWNPKGLLALPAPEGSLATEESDIALQFGAPSRAGIGQFGSQGFAQIQGAGYQQQRQMQLQQSQDGFGVQRSVMGGQFGTAGYAMSQNAMYQQRLQQLKQQQQQQEAPGTELGMQYGSDQGAQSQYGSPTRAQDQKALYQPKLQQQQMLQQQILQQQQQQQQQQLQLQSFSQANQRLGDEAVLYSQGMESNASGSGFPQQQQQLIQQGQFGAAGYAQSQSAMYQQKLMQQRQKQQQLKQQQQQQQQQLLEGPGQEAGMEGVQQPGYAPNPLYQQQDLQQQQQQQQLQQQQQQQQPPANASASGQLGSAQYAQGQAAMYQQRLQQLKQRQQQQQQQSREPTPSPSQAYQSQQQGQQMQVQPANSYQASPNGDRQMLSVAASAAVQAAALSSVPGDQMGSVGYALAQNAKYQQQLQQQQLRRQQRQQLEQQQQQLQQQPTAQMQLVQARQQQQPSQQSAPARLPLSNEVTC